MKIKIDLRKPRNPFVAFAMARKAGSHRKSNKQERLAAKAESRSMA